MEYQSGAVRAIDSIKEGWNIIKDNYWMYVLMMLVVVIIYIALALILQVINGAVTGGISAYSMQAVTIFKVLSPFLTFIFHAAIDTMPLSSRL